ncbi:MAG: NUDIX hydrolase [Bacillota bacterium]
MAVLALDEQERAILVRQYRQAAGSVMLEIPAGKLDPGENPADCARRELAEETGLQGGSWRELGCFFLSPGFCNEKITLFRVTGLSEAPPAARDEDEKIEIIRIPLADMINMIRRGEIMDAKTVIAVALSTAHTA